MPAGIRPRVDQLTQPSTTAPAPPPVLRSVAEVADFVRDSASTVHVRFGEPDDDLRAPSIDHESGLTLPGLSVNPLSPPSWWRDRPLEDWVVRQICSYAHLQQNHPERACVLVTGTVVERGPDNEPLLAGADLVAVLTPDVVREARRRHPGSPRPEDAPAEDGAAPWQA